MGQDYALACFWLQLQSPSTTKMSPYFMLHARHPVIPPAQVHNFTLPIDLDKVEELVKSVLHRAKIAEKAGIIAGENLKIAQHREALRYATIRGGGYLTSVRQFSVGDFVTGREGLWQAQYRSWLRKKYI
jgi:hypothetical protein